VAHQDDLEFAALAPIAACLEDSERWFTGVACTDGSGSARTGVFAECTDEEMRVLRRQEQRAAAEIGGYSAIFQLGHPSADIRGDGHAALVAELVEILTAAQPVNVYTHNTGRQAQHPSGRRGGQLPAGEKKPDLGRKDTPQVPRLAPAQPIPNLALGCAIWRCGRCPARR